MKKLLFLLSLIMFAGFASATHNVSNDITLTVTSDDVTDGRIFYINIPLVGSPGGSSTLSILDEADNLSSDVADLHWVGVLYQDAEGVLYSVNEASYGSYLESCGTDAFNDAVISSSGSVLTDATFLDDFFSCFSGEEAPDFVDVTELTAVARLAQVEFSTAGTLVFDSFVNGSYAKSFCIEFYPVTSHLINHSTLALKNPREASFFSITPTGDESSEENTFVAADEGDSFIVVNSLCMGGSGNPYTLVPLGGLSYPDVSLSVNVADTSFSPLSGYTVTVSRGEFSSSKVTNDVGGASFDLGPNKHYLVSVTRGNEIYGVERLLNISTDYTVNFKVDPVSDYSFTLRADRWSVKELSFGLITQSSIDFIKATATQLTGRNFAGNLWMLKPKQSGTLAYDPNAVSNAFDITLGDSWTALPLSPEIMSARPKDVLEPYELREQSFTPTGETAVSGSVFYWDTSAGSIGEFKTLDLDPDDLSSDLFKTFKTLNFEPGDVLFSAGKIGFKEFPDELGPDGQDDLSIFCEGHLDCPLEHFCNDNNYCQLAECTSTDQCGVDEVCHEYKCKNADEVGVTACQSDYDCISEQVCLNNSFCVDFNEQCVGRHGLSCSVGNACVVGATCVDQGEGAFCNSEVATYLNSGEACGPEGSDVCTTVPGFNAVCLSPQCTSAADCDDGNVCTTNLCSNFTCTSTNNTGLLCSNYPTEDYMTCNAGGSCVSDTAPDVLVDLYVGDVSYDLSAGTVTPTFGLSATSEGEVSSLWNIGQWSADGFPFGFLESGEDHTTTTTKGNFFSGLVSGTHNMPPFEEVLVDISISPAFVPNINFGPLGVYADSDPSNNIKIVRIEADSYSFTPPAGYNVETLDASSDLHSSWGTGTLLTNGTTQETGFLRFDGAVSGLNTIHIPGRPELCSDGGVIQARVRAMAPDAIVALKLSCGTTGGFLLNLGTSESSNNSFKSSIAGAGLQAIRAVAIERGEWSIVRVEKLPGSSFFRVSINGQQIDLSAVATNILRNGYDTGGGNPAISASSGFGSNGAVDFDYVMTNNVYGPDLEVTAIRLRTAYPSTGNALPIEFDVYNNGSDLAIPNGRFIFDAALNDVPGQRWSIDIPFIPSIASLNYQETQTLGLIVIPASVLTTAGTKVITVTPRTDNFSIPDQIFRNNAMTKSVTVAQSCTTTADCSSGLTCNSVDGSASDLCTVGTPDLAITDVLLQNDSVVVTVENQGTGQATNALIDLLQDEPTSQTSHPACAVDSECASIYNLSGNQCVKNIVTNSRFCYAPCKNITTDYSACTAVGSLTLQSCSNTTTTIPAGGSTTVTFNLKELTFDSMSSNRCSIWPNGSALQNRRHYYKVSADRGNVVTELNENNNVLEFDFLRCDSDSVCGGNICSNNVCTNSCSNDTDCSAGYYCSQQECALSPAPMITVSDFQLNNFGQGTFSLTVDVTNRGASADNVILSLLADRPSSLVGAGAVCLNRTDVSYGSTVCDIKTTSVFSASHPVVELRGQTDVDYATAGCIDQNLGTIGPGETVSHEFRVDAFSTTLTGPTTHSGPFGAPYATSNTEQCVLPVSLTPSGASYFAGTGFTAVIDIADVIGDFNEDNASDTIRVCTAAADCEAGASCVANKCGPAA